jgi:hypothetical protein
MDEVKAVIVIVLVTIVILWDYMPWSVKQMEAKERRKDLTSDTEEVE